MGGAPATFADATPEPAAPAPVTAPVVDVAPRATAENPTKSETPSALPVEQLEGWAAIKMATTQRTGRIFHSQKRLREFLKKHGIVPESTGSKGTPVRMPRSALDRLSPADPPTPVGTRRND